MLCTTRTKYGKGLFFRFGRRWSHVGCMLTATGRKLTITVTPSKFTITVTTSQLHLQL